jgi:hypothetical protein
MNSLKYSRNLAARPHAGLFSILILLAGWPATSVTQAADMAATNTPAAIPWNQIGAKAGANYQGDGLAVTPAGSGARLHCVFQRLDGEATPEGLWLISTVTNTVSDRFRVTATAVGRVTPCAPGAADRTFNIQHSTSNIQLEEAGIISLVGQTVRLSRPGLTEEYSVSMDGVRQDFIVEQAPDSPPAGELVVKLAVTGAQVEPAADGARPVRYPQQIEETENGSSISHGARLVLDHSGRKIAYSRLRVTDATGKELPARVEVCPVGDEVTSLNSLELFGNDVEDQSLLTSAATSGELAVVVNDATAVYPVRIDPTFSDANWVSMGGIAGANGTVYTAVIDGSGNLYIGGAFTIVGNVFANYIAEWNGSSWLALGSGIGGEYPQVVALAVSGSTLYPGGNFSTAGTNVSAYAAMARRPLAGYLSCCLQGPPKMLTGTTAPFPIGATKRTCLSSSPLARRSPRSCRRCRNPARYFREWSESKKTITPRCSSNGSRQLGLPAYPCTATVTRGRNGPRPSECPDGSPSRRLGTVPRYLRGHVPKRPRLLFSHWRNTREKSRRCQRRLTNNLSA